MPELTLEWRSPGPVASQFMASRGEVQCINGPVGSGKTTATMIKAIRLAGEQKPTPRRRAIVPGYPDGVPIRMFRLCVVRDTYRNLWRTTLPSWFKRVPKEIGDWHGGENQPCQHVVKFMLGATLIEFVADFIAIGDNSIEDVLRGYEPTAFYLNEADLLAWQVFQFCTTRWGRYPEMADGGPTWSGCLMDCNAPIIGSEFHEEVFLGGTPGVALFRQPGGDEAGAENLENLPADYYARQKQYLSEQLFRRMVQNLPGFSDAGKGVHPEFNDRLHVRDIEPIPGLPLYIGFDAGLDPAALIGQKLGNGRWHILDEVVCPHGTGPIRFARELTELLHARYGEWTAQAIETRAYDLRRRETTRARIRGYADPAAFYGGDRNSEAEADRTWAELVSHHTGIGIEPAPSNDTTTRREGLRNVLTLMPDGQPAFAISPRCVKTRAGLTGGFRYRQVNTGGGSHRYSDEVDKNEFSHPCEALEYLMLGGGEGAAIFGRREQEYRRASLPRQTDSEVALP